MNYLGYFKANILPHLVSIAVILCFSAAIFAPQLDGQRISAGDIVSSDAKTKHIKDYMKETGNRSYWNSAQFSGGPIYLLNLGQENNVLGYIQKLVTLNKWGPIGMFFSIGVLMYFSLLTLGVNRWLSLVLSLGYMLSYVFFTLLDAGHFKKIDTLSYIPLILSGLIVILRNEYLKGSFALLVGISLALYLGHVQMVYYVILALVGFGLPLLGYAIAEKRTVKLFQGLGVAVFIALMAASSNFAQLSASQSFSNQTMRGGGILPKVEDQAEVDKAGLTWDYAMSWSYEMKDFFNIIIPRVVGGGSQEKIDKDNPLAQLMLKNNAPLVKGKVAVPGYWSSMPFTSGGTYVGAALFFLFVFSIGLMRRDLAMGFALSFFLIFLLSLGQHAEWFNRPLYDYLPLFDKFRAPSSAVSILPAFIVLASGIGLNEVFKSPTNSENFKKLYISAGISLGILALVLLVGLFSFSFLSPSDFNYPYEIQSILVEGRKALFQSDAIRSLGFVLTCAVLFWMYMKEIIKNQAILLLGLFLIFTIDMLPVDRRTLTEENFISENLYLQQFNPRPADQQISLLEPNGRGYYRVLDLSVNTFNDALPAYHHNQIGGYDPTKLQRYQDVIEYHITKNNISVLNMLNTKYVINKEGKVQTNPQANGNAWFVNEVKYVDSPINEINALTALDTKNTAVVLSNEFGKDIQVGNQEGSIGLLEYEPNRLVYQSKSASPQLAVFSEVWYGGELEWKALIDGQEVDLIRTNYILRALELPAGDHEIIMEFKPKAKGALVSSISSILGLLMLLGIIGYGLKNSLMSESASMK